jgi:hypothetical protein
MVAMATAMETAAAGAAMTAAGTPTTALGIGADGIAFATAWEGCGCWLTVVCEVVRAGCVCAVVLLEETARHIGDRRKALDETNQTITFN